MLFQFYFSLRLAFISDTPYVSEIKYQNIRIMSKQLVPFLAAVTASSPEGGRFQQVMRFTDRSVAGGKRLLVQQQALPAATP